MKTFTLKNKFQTNATLVANDFIDHYMVQANGEFVKVYLFLLRHLDNAGSSLTVSAVADCLNNTENDILRAFKNRHMRFSTGHWRASVRVRV